MQQQNEVTSAAPPACVPHSIVDVLRTIVRGDTIGSGQRPVAEETAIAFSYNRLSHAVMMATPADLEDFAVGFSLTEGIVEHAADIEELAVIPARNGVELRMWIDAGRLTRLAERRRQIAGPTGCGLCGLESLDQAMRIPPPVNEGRRYSFAEIAAAVASLGPAQHLNQVTRAVHAAGIWQPGAGLLALREDVGRHNALDKLAGAIARQRIDPAASVLVMTSRISVELVQKAARIGAAILCAVSAPTALALRVAEQAGMTLVGIARDDGFEVFTWPDRIRSC